MQRSRYVKNLISDFLLNKEGKTAFTLYDGENLIEISYKQFATDILKATTYFKKNEISNQNIAIIANNGYEWLVTFFAISATGNVAVPMNRGLTKETLCGQCEKAKVSYVYMESNLQDELRDYNTYKYITYHDFENNPASDINEITNAKTTDNFVLIFTSGTTGKSKIVEITESNFWYAIHNQENSLDVKRERFYLNVPMFHIAGIVSAVLVLHMGQTLCIGRETKYMLADMAALNPTDVNFVPAMLEALARVLKTAKTPQAREKMIGSNLKNIGVGAAKINPDTCRFLMDLGFNILVGYAMTELTGDGTRAILDEKHINSIGKTFGKMECKIEDGELMFRGPSVMKGYYNDTAETDKVIEDGWIHTGDLGYCDEDGYYYITGRKKNVMILPNGENVNPEELEAAVYECSAVIECMVYNDAKGICIDVYTDNNEAVKEKVKNYNETVPKYRQIYKVNTFDAPLEKTGSGKIKRKGNAYV